MQWFAPMVPADRKEAKAGGLHEPRSFKKKEEEGRKEGRKENFE